MHILFLHGWQSSVGGLKPTWLTEQGHDVINPALPDDDFEACVAIAQHSYDDHHPDVIVGSSRGGAVALNLNSEGTPLVLLCPAWKHWGQSSTVQANCLILHSRDDEIIPFADSEELIANSGLSQEHLIATGSEHRLSDEASLLAMTQACETLVQSANG